MAVRPRTAGLRPVLELGPRVLPDPHAGRSSPPRCRTGATASSGPHASAVVARWLDGVQMVMTAIGLRPPAPLTPIRSRGSGTAGHAVGGWARSARRAAPSSPSMQR